MTDSAYIGFADEEADVVTGTVDDDGTSGEPTGDAVTAGLTESVVHNT